MRTFIQKFQTFPFKRYLYLSIILSLITIGVVLILQKNLPPEVPIFYGRPVGKAQLTKTLGLTLPPLLSIFILGVNFALALLAPDTFIKKVLIAAAFTVSILTTITVIKVVFLVGFF